jgi:hypothetical protein
MAATTIMTNLGVKQQTNLTKYSLFLGGTNVRNEVLQVYDPLTTGYGRLFMVKKPVFVDKQIKTQLNQFKHILEYGNTAISGINDVSVNFNQIQGGYNGKSFEIPSYASDDTNSFTVNVYEFSGSPVRQVIHYWINGTCDLLTGLAHYGGASDKYSRIQANQTAEFIYVNTDRTGTNVEYACLLANCFPKNINTDVFNYTSGEHNLVETNLEFTCTKYESTQINAVAQKLVTKYALVANSINFYSGYSAKTPVYTGYVMNETDGTLKSKS